MYRWRLETAPTASGDAAIDRELGRRISQGVRAAAIDALAAVRGHLDGAFPAAGGRMGRLVDAYYPEEEATALDPVAAIVARGRKAEAILRAWSEGTTVRGRQGQWLAIPTDAVPWGYGSRRYRLRPDEVERVYGRPLRWIASPDRRFGLLVMDGLTRARSGRGYRQATAGRLAQGRAAEAVTMFVLVPSVSIPRRIDPQRAIQAVFDRVGEYIDRA